MKNAKLIFAAGCCLSVPLLTKAQEKPNVVIIYVDDLGYGDISCQRNVKNENYVKTPNIDRLASEGIRFKSAYSAAATCTPSRYSLLTGEYSFRQRGTGVLQGDAKMIIDQDRQTLPGVFQKSGYKTGVVGKWHLGLGKGEKIDWNRKLSAGPNEIGFDYSYILPATNDRVPFIFVENNKVVNGDMNDPIAVNYRKKIGDDPTGREKPELLKIKFSEGHDGTIINGISRIGFMTGGQKARLVDEDIPDCLLKQSCEFIDNAQKEKKPFLLYFSTIDIHVPRAPHSRFLGKSKLGTRGDVLLQLDWTVGEIFKILEKRGILDNTMILFSSDNGPVLGDGYADNAQKLADKYEYNPAGEFRGTKYQSFEGGARVPFIIRYPQKIKTGQVSEAMISQVDLLASFASMLGCELNTKTAPDSQNQLAALFGKDKIGRKSVMFEATSGPVMRLGNWKFWIHNRAGYRSAKGNGLFDLSKDLEEKNNLFSNSDFSEKVAELKTIYEKEIGKK